MDIKEELTKVSNDIEKLASDYVDTRGKAQIANLIDKISVRQKLPNMVSKVKIAGVKDPVKVSFIDFLQGINTEVPEKDKSKLLKLEKRKIALTLLLESEEEPEEPIEE